MPETPTLKATLEAADEVLTVLREHQADAVIIGAMALAVHGYTRDTTDFDLAVAVDPKQLNVIGDALATASPLVPNSTLRVVDLPHLIAFKLYAGGPKSRLDILELLSRNPSLDRNALHTLCEDYRLSAELREVLKLEGDT
jgi:hypothetical protein